MNISPDGSNKALPWFMTSASTCSASSRTPIHTAAAAAVVDIAVATSTAAAIATASFTTVLYVAPQCHQGSAKETRSRLDWDFIMSYWLLCLHPLVNTSRCATILGILVRDVEFLG